MWNRKARRSMFFAEGAWQRTSPKSKITARIAGGLGIGLYVSAAIHRLPLGRGGSTKRQIFVRQMQVILKHFDYKIVIVALGQPGNGDRAHASCARENYREAAAMRSVVFWIEAGFRLQSGLGPLVREANSVRTAVIALDD